MKYSKIFLWIPTLLVALLFVAPLAIQAVETAAGSASVAVGNTGLGSTGNTGLSPTGNTGNNPTGNTGNAPRGNTGNVSFNPYNPQDGKPVTTLCQLVQIFLRVVIRIGGVVATIFIIWSGFLFIKAQGNKDQIEKAKWAFYTTIIGTAILLGSVAISELIFNTLNNITNIGPKC